MSIPSLNQAIKDGCDLSTIDELMRQGASIDERDEDRNTPLINAILGGKDSIADHLIDQGTNLRASNRTTKTALHVATELNRIAIAKKIAQKDPDSVHKHDFFSRNSTPIIIATEKGHVEIVSAFLEIIPKLINLHVREGGTLLHIACEEGHYELAVFLLATSSHLITTEDNFERTPLHLASASGNRNLVQFLVSKGADFKFRDYNRDTALHSAAFKGKLATAKFLVDLAPELIFVTNKKCWAPLHTSVKSGNVDLVKFLIAANAPINASAVRGTTPLHLAADLRKEAVVQTLLKKMANPNIFDHDRETPIHIAAKSGDESTTKLLIEHHAKIDEENEKGQSPLTLAIQQTHLYGTFRNIVERLLVEGANPQQSTSSPFEPIQVAISGWNLRNSYLRDIIKSLIIAGAEPPKNQDVVKALGGRMVVDGLSNTWKALPYLRLFSVEKTSTPQKRQKVES